MLGAVAALLNPAALVVGGPWAGAPASTDVSRPVPRRSSSLLPLVPAGVGLGRPALGARVAALGALRTELFDLGRP